MASDANIIANAQIIIDGTTATRQQFDDINRQIQEIKNNPTAEGAAAKVSEIKAALDAARAEANATFGTARTQLKKDLDSSMYVGSDAKTQSNKASALYTSLLSLRDLLTVQIDALPAIIADAKAKTAADSAVTDTVKKDPPVNTTNEENKENSGENQDKDDNSNEGTNSAPAPNDSGPSASKPPASGNKQKQTPKSDENNPSTTSIRRWNPLSKLSSYTYNLTLYMVTPDCANYFTFNGKLDPAGGWYIVAQSGGINSDLEPRAITQDPEGALGPGKPGLDYYLEDFNIEIFLLGADGQKTSTAATSVTFKVIEPQGFTFLTRLRKTSNQINKISKLINQGHLESRPNLYQQHYMIGVKFYGYDAAGNIIESSSFPESPITLDDKYAIYERIFPLIASKVAFKIDGKAVIYNFDTMVTNEQAAYGTKRGFLFGNAEIQGATVGDILGSATTANKNSMIGWLNDNQQVLKSQEKQDLSQTYDIDWGGFKEIYTSKMNTDSDAEIASSASSPLVISENTSTPKAAAKATTIDKNSVLRGISPNTPIVSVIDQIITKSSYVSDTLTKKNKAIIEAETKDDTAGYLQWYAINPVVKVLGRDKKTNDWAYDITYQILPFQVPYLRSQYVVSKSKYYGPVKQYSYTLTGENTEVVSFEMDYNNLYYVPSASSTTKDAPPQKNTQGAPTVATPTDASVTTGKLYKGDDIVNSVRASLYSIGDQALASIKIMGDPDFLMSSVGYKIPPNSENFKKFYGKDGSISPYNGQVFIEIIFKVAEDYKSNGLLDVDANQTIAFYPTEEQKTIGNTGLIYKIKSVKSNFSRGKFEQTLDLYMVPTNQLIIPSNENDGSNDRAESTRFKNYAPPQYTSEGGGRGSDAFAAADPRRLDLPSNTAIEPANRQADVNPEDLRPGTGASNTDPASSYTASEDSSKKPLQQAPVTTNTSTGSTQDDDAGGQRTTPQYVLTAAEQQLRIDAAEFNNSVETRLRRGSVGQIPPGEG